jgi:tripartite-type tricarboxylate transporter receptor subunit TctC
VPAIADSGLPGYEMVGWHGIFAPAGTPRDIVERLSTTIAKILAAADIRELWNTQAMEILPSSPEQFATRLRYDYERYGKLIQNSGIRIQQ